MTSDGRLSAVIDFGCSAIGDPACDLVVAWTMFDSDNRQVFRDHVRLDDDTWTRARGWALWKALLTLRRATRVQRTQAGDQKAPGSAATRGFDGGDDGNRTHDPLLAKQVL